LTNNNIYFIIKAVKKITMSRIISTLALLSFLVIPFFSTANKHDVVVQACQFPAVLSDGSGVCLDDWEQEAVEALFDF
jgi:hypothetical protein